MTTPLPKMVNPRFWVWFDDTPEAEPITVRVRNSDLILWDDTAAKHPGWKGPDVAPWRWSSFVTWSALRRVGEIGTEPFEAFADRVVEVRAVPDDDDDDPSGSPTLPGPDPG
jgi:hypothetical protein